MKIDNLTPAQLQSKWKEVDAYMLKYIDINHMFVPEDYHDDVLIISLLLGGPLAPGKAADEILDFRPYARRFPRKDEDETNDREKVSKRMSKMSFLRSEDKPLRAKIEREGLNEFLPVIDKNKEGQWIVKPSGLMFLAYYLDQLILHRAQMALMAQKRIQEGSANIPESILYFPDFVIDKTVLNNLMNAVTSFHESYPDEETFGVLVNGFVDQDVRKYVSASLEQLKTLRDLTNELKKTRAGHRSLSSIVSYQDNQREWLEDFKAQLGSTTEEEVE